MKLFFRQSGEGPPLVILHGLFGSSDNWHTLAKTFSQHFTVYTVDQRNHGQSPHSDDFSYRLLAEDLEEFLNERGIGKVLLIGHSMGGKAAMSFAVHRPDRVEKLLVVDIIPKRYAMRYERIVQGMKGLPLDTLASRADAESKLMPFIPDPAERQFIMKNLERRTGGGFDWKVNLASLDVHMADLGEAIAYTGVYSGPVLFLTGTQSNYFAPGDEAAVTALFPNAVFKTLDTGHWVQAEKPQEFAAAALEFFTPRRL